MSERDSPYLASPNGDTGESRVEDHAELTVVAIYLVGA